MLSNKNTNAHIKTVSAIGFSAMMHGYMPFGKDGELLVPFRTWRNTTTGQAAEQLTDLFQFNIPQRWSIAHLYQAILNEEPHVKAYQPSDHPGRLCSLETYRAKGAGSWRRLWHVPHRFHD